MSTNINSIPPPRGLRKAKSKLTNKHTEFQSPAHLAGYVNGNQSQETRFFKKNTRRRGPPLPPRRHGSRKTGGAKSNRFPKRSRRRRRSQFLIAKYRTPELKKNNKKKNDSTPSRKLASLQRACHRIAFLQAPVGGFVCHIIIIPPAPPKNPSKESAGECVLPRSATST